MATLSLGEDLQVICDPESTVMAEFTAKFGEFRETLNEDQRSYLDFICRAADVAAAEHGMELLTDIDQFEPAIQKVLGDDYTPAHMGGVVIRTTVVTRCATWLLRC